MSSTLKLKQNTHNQIIAGIDPGTTHMGYAVIETFGDKIVVKTIGALKLSQYSDQGVKLRKIFERVLQLVDDFHPDHVALEAPFFGKNVQSMLKLGRAQGVAMAAALYRDIPITEYAPKRIKQSITGNGNASKEQVAAMLQHLLNENFADERLDATDALSVAYCHFLQQKSPLAAGKKTNWEDFLKNNPDRLR